MLSYLGLGGAWVSLLLGSWGMGTWRIKNKILNVFFPMHIVIPEAVNSLVPGDRNVPFLLPC